MTYNKNQTLKTILIEFLNKKIISMSVYLEMINNASNYQLVEDFLIHCITKFDIAYKNYPLNYKSDINFLREVCAVRPSVIEELKKSNKSVYNALFTNLSLTDKELPPIISKQNKSKIKKIGPTIIKEVG